MWFASQFGRDSGAFKNKLDFEIRLRTNLDDEQAGTAEVEASVDVSLLVDQADVDMEHGWEDAETEDEERTEFGEVIDPHK